jgi:hypothetical protein
MAFPFFTAVNNATTTLNTIKGWVTDLISLSRELADAHGLLQDISYHVSITKIVFDQWKDQWGLTERTHDNYQRQLWGKYSQSVQSHIRDTEDMFQSIKNTLAPYNESFSRLSKGEFVTNTGPNIVRDLKRAEERIGKLHKVCLEAFGLKRKIPTPERVSEEERNQARESVYVQLAAEARKPSAGLYKSCHVGSGQARPEFEFVKLEIDLSRAQQGYTLERGTELPAFILYYHFVIYWNANLVDLFIEGPHSQGPIVQPIEGEDPTRFISAVMDAVSNGGHDQMPLRFQIQYSPTGTWFISRTSSQEEKIWPTGRPREPKRVADILYDLSQTPGVYDLDEFPLSHRIDLAFKVAECGLMLAGTTWLSKFSTQVIERCPQSRQSVSRFLLETKVRQNPLNEADQQALAAHIFSIGIVLAEIGLGGRILPTGEARRPRTAANPILQSERSFSLERPARNGTIRSPITMARIESDLASISTYYAGAVMYCLADKRASDWKSIRNGTLSPEDEKYKNVLAEYYLKVYEP